MRNSNETLILALDEENPPQTTIEIEYKPPYNLTATLKRIDPMGSGSPPLEAAVQAERYATSAQLVYGTTCYKLRSDEKEEERTTPYGRLKVSIDTDRFQFVRSQVTLGEDRNPDVQLVALKSYAYKAMTDTRTVRCMVREGPDTWRVLAYREPGHPMSVDVTKNEQPIKLSSLTTRQK